MSSTIQCIQRPTHRSAAIGVLVLAAFAAMAAACTQTSLTEPDESADKCQVTLTASQAAIPGGGGTASVAIAASAECEWTATTSATWISNLTPASGQGAGSVQFTAAANPTRTTREADIDVNGRLARVRQDAAVCAFTVAPTALTVAGSAGTSSVTVTTLAGCTWSAATQTPWITITSQANNNDGSGTVTFTTAQNTTGATRAGSLTVAGQTISVTQTTAACGYSINPPSYAVGNGGGTTTVAVTTTQACAWTAASNDSWITVTSGASGTGPGDVGLTVAANTGGPRNGTVQIAGQAFSVNQTAAGCSYSVSAPTPSNVGVNGTSPGSPITATVTTASHCTWNAVSSDPSFLQVTQGASGTGNGPVQATMSANTGAGRTGRIAVAGFIVAVTQDPCSYTFGPSQPNVLVAGGSGSVSITTGTACPWSASSDQLWLTITAPSGTVANSGTITFNVGDNSGGGSGVQRSANISVQGTTSTFTVTQNGCNTSINPTSDPTTPVGGLTPTAGVSIAVTTGCPWTAVANNNPQWITVTSGLSGTGDGTVGWTFAGNTGPSRQGTITIAGQTFTATQAACTYSLTPTSSPLIPLGGGVGNSINIDTNGDACQWNASSSAPSWLTISATSAGDGTLMYDVQPQPPMSPQRQGNITIGNQTFTVTQEANP